jgi:hypothetical protein
MRLATTAQRDLIVRLLRAAEYDLRTVSRPHIALANRANPTKSPPEAGTLVDTWLDRLTKSDASDLITRLRTEAGR